MRMLLNAIAASSAAAAAHAAPVAFTAPSWNRPATTADSAADGTTYQAWGTFTTTYTPAPDGVTVANEPNVVANAFETSLEQVDLNQIDAPAAFLTSGGNIYSPGQTVGFLAEVPAASGLGGIDFWVQVRTLGTELDYASLALDGVLVSTLPGYSRTELRRETSSFGGSPSQNVETRFTFTGPAGLASYDLTFDASGSSTSLDDLSIDTRAVPEPALATALAFAGALVLRRRR